MRRTGLGWAATRRTSTRTARSACALPPDALPVPSDQTSWSQHHKKSKSFHNEVLEVESKIHDADTPKDQCGLKIRMWLESRQKEKAGRQFSSYELIVPELLVGVKAKM